MNKMRFFFLFFCYFLIMPLTCANNQPLHYEPDLVELVGTVKLITFPGPPNYEDIKKGDRVEKCPYLTLEKSIDVDLLPGVESSINEPEKNVKVVQISDDREQDRKKFQNGKRLCIRGILFHRFTGHHHTRVLMVARHVDEIPQGIKKENSDLFLVDQG